MEWINRYWYIRDIVIPLLEIILLSNLIFSVYRLVVKTRGVLLIRGALYLGIFYLIAYIFQLTTLLWLMNLLAPSLVIALAIIFQPEIRKIFTRFGQGRLLRSRRHGEVLDLDPILTASWGLMTEGRGALIVLSRTASLMGIADSGIMLDADLSVELLLTIFLHNTKLHDGAVIIEHGRILAASCLLPLSIHNQDRLSHGTRHRAALGMSEESDAAIIVISEERADISLAYQGDLHAIKSKMHLLELTSRFFENSRVSIYSKMMEGK